MRRPPSFALGAADAARALLAALPHAAWLASLENATVLAANGAAGALFGCPPEALVGRRADELAASPEDIAWWAAAQTCPADAQALGALDSDTVIAGPEGATLDVRRTITPLGADADHVLPTEGAGQALALVTVVDFTARARIEREREAELADLQATLESSADGLLVTGPDGRIRSFNRRLAQLWSLPASLMQRHDDDGIAAWMQRSVQAPEPYAERLRVLRDAPLLAATDRLELVDGTVLERTTRPLVRAGRPQGRVWAFRDLSERIAAEERIESLGNTDALTQLPNRRRFNRLIDDALGAQRGGGRGFALLLVDLDRFGKVNDSLGHEVGDRVLQQVGERLSGCLRDGDALARLGGDQFAALLMDTDAPAAEAAARRMLHVVAQPCQLANANFTITCSIGIALAPSMGRSADELSRHAEAAMKAVKLRGRADVRLHQARAEVDRRAHMKLDHAMRQALVSGRFRLVYQPQLELAAGRIVGAEALLRWRDPEMGEVPPGRFIPVAEESGFIAAIGDWVLAQAVRQAALWHQRGLEVPIAVNVSALQFQHAQFADRVASVLAVSGLPPEMLELELTESILVHDADEALARLTALARLGVRLSIDDFGTGYSSLSYLKRFPIRKLKIDRSFVAGLPADETDAGIVRAILQMARALGLTVIAEGVETEAQRQFLVAEGCAEMQGFLYAPPLDPLSFEERLHAATSRPSPRPAALPPAPRMRLVRT